jgi:hypothetical protein
VTSPYATAPEGLSKQVKRMQRAAVERDQRMMTMGLVRQGKPEVLFEDLFSDTWRKPIVANFIHTVAQEQADLLAPLPALSCSVGSMKSDADKRRAAQRNKVGTHYMRESNLSMHMHTFADSLMTYGFAVMYAEPCYESQLPLIRTMPSVGTYYENDRFGNTLRLAHCYKETVDKLASMFPRVRAADPHQGRPVGQPHGVLGRREARGRPVDRRHPVVPVPARPRRPGRGPLRGAQTSAARCGWPSCPTCSASRSATTTSWCGCSWPGTAWRCCPGGRRQGGRRPAGGAARRQRAGRRPGLGDRHGVPGEGPPRRARGAELRVRAGADAGAGAAPGRPLPGGPGDRHGRLGDHRPGRARVDGLVRRADRQSAQAIIGNCLARTLEFCFETDVKVWPNTRKRITGQVNGEPYDVSYTPAKDIGDVYTVDVSYGFAAGLSPNAAVVMLLQLSGDGLIDRSTVRRNMPFAIDDEAMQRSMDVEQTADALKQGLGGLLASLGPMAAQGMDPRPTCGRPRRSSRGAATARTWPT